MQEQSIFIEALEKEPADRAAFLERVCGSDRALRQRIDRLLERHRPDDSFFEAEGHEPSLSNLEQNATGPGTIIGPYKLLQQIGEGGMGIVFMAERSEPVRQIVAIKIIKPGMDSRQVIARFEAERQALDMMDHPNIAKVFDAGSITRRASVLACSDDADMPPAKPTSEDACATETGRPFFVMELVKGVPITKYCDDNQLTLKERLELFIPVCQAVMHAHQKGIIHRDLKPSNVLVARYDDKPVPKVIDFGVAKATGQKLTERTLFTHFGQLVGTLEYMSPEQATLNALDIDTRSDIYSLGVLLYELLTGSTPFEKKRLKETAFDEVLRIIREEEPPTPSKRLSRSRLPSGNSVPRDAVFSDEDPPHATATPGPARQAGPTLEIIAAHRKIDPAKLTKLVRGDLDWIVMKALDKDRNRRYETASAFGADVERYLKDEAVEACPPSAGYRLRRFVRRKKFELIIAACVLLTLTGLTGGIGWAVRDRAGREEEIMRQQRARENEISSKVMELITEGHALITDGRQALGRQKLTEARRLITNDRAALTAVVAEVEAFEAEQPETAAAFNQLAWLLASHPDPKFRDPHRAVDIAKRAVTAAPTVGPYWNTLGVAHYRAGDWQEALAALERSINLHAKPDSWDMFFVAMAQWRLGQKVEARKSYEWAAKWFETNGSSFDSEELLRYQEEAAILLGLPTPVATLLRPGQRSSRPTPWSKGSLEKAITNYSVAIKLDPKSALAFNSRGNTYGMLGQWNEAVADYSEAIKLVPTFAHAWTNRGSAYQELQQWDKAIGDFSKAIELNPMDPQGPSDLAWMLSTHIDSKVRDPGRALILAKKAVALAPKVATYWNRLGIAQYRARNWQAALLALEKSMELSSIGGTGWDWFFVAMAQWQIGHKDEAHKLYKRAVNWMEAKQLDSDQLRRFRAEAAKLLGVKE